MSCVAFNAGQFGLTKDCVAQCEAILSVEISQIEQGGPLGVLDDGTVRTLIRAIGFVIASDCEPD